MTFDAQHRTAHSFPSGIVQERRSKTGGTYVSSRWCAGAVVKHCALHLQSGAERSMLAGIAVEGQTIEEIPGEEREKLGSMTTGASC